MGGGCCPWIFSPPSLFPSYSSLERQCRNSPLLDTGGVEDRGVCIFSNTRVPRPGEECRSESVGRVARVKYARSWETRRRRTSEGRWYPRRRISEIVYYYYARVERWLFIPEEHLSWHICSSYTFLVLTEPIPTRSTAIFANPRWTYIVWYDMSKRGNELCIPLAALYVRSTTVGFFFLCACFFFFVLLSHFLRRFFRRLYLRFRRFQVSFALYAEHFLYLRPWWRYIYALALRIMKYSKRDGGGGGGESRIVWMVTIQVYSFLKWFLVRISKHVHFDGIHFSWIEWFGVIKYVLWLTPRSATAISWMILVVFSKGSQKKPGQFKNKAQCDSRSDAPVGLLFFQIGRPILWINVAQPYQRIAH